MTKSKKLLTLLDAYRRLVVGFSGIDDKVISELAASYSLSLEEVDEFIGNGKFPVKPSIIAAGFEQGFLEIPQIIYSSNSSNKLEAMRIYNDVANTFFPGHVEVYNSKVNAILARGTIKSEKEWYLIRHRIDDLQIGGADSSTLEVLDSLLLKYEQNV